MAKLLLEEVVDEDGIGFKPTRMRREEKELRDAIAKVRKTLQRAEARLAKLEAKCKHRVRFDTADWPYDYRTCHICGEGMGLI